MQMIYGTCNYIVYECSNYPFCSFDNLSNEKKKIIYEDGSYSISFILLPIIFPMVISQNYESCQKNF